MPSQIHNNENTMALAESSTVPTMDVSTDKKVKRKSRWFTKIRLTHKKGSSSQTIGLDGICDTCSENSSSRNDPLDTTRREGGCLKIPTQTQSLAEDYESPVGLDRSVRFGSMQVLVFGLQLGDNPSVSVGPPLAMSNELAADFSLDIEAYEETRPPRRQKQELAVPRPIREDWLRDEGHSRGEFRQAEERILAIKKSRKACVPSNCSVKDLFKVKLFNSTTKKQQKRTSVLR